MNDTTIRSIPYSLIISIIAIVISRGVPLLQWLYKKTKKLKLSIMPFENNTVSLLFNESGCYFKLMFCIQCENQDTTITSIEVTLKRQSYTWKKHTNSLSLILYT